MNILDQWEALLKLKPENQLAAIKAHRMGLALIDLVRKKDETLKKYSEIKLAKIQTKNELEIVIGDLGCLAQKALALTEQLK